MLEVQEVPISGEQFDKTAETLASFWWIPHTVWNFQDFFITQILRKINFVDSRGEKSTISSHLEALNFNSVEFLHFLKAEIDYIMQVQSPQ